MFVAGIRSPSGQDLHVAGIEHCRVAAAAIATVEARPGRWKQEETSHCTVLGFICNEMTSTSVGFIAENLWSQVTQHSTAPVGFLSLAISLGEHLGFLAAPGTVQLYPPVTNRHDIF